MTALIELAHVTKVYGEGDAEVRALDGIDLTIADGDFVAVMGTQLLSQRDPTRPTS